MDRVNYAALLEKLLLAHQDGDSSGLVESQVSIDKERGHYQMLSVGWERGQRVYHVLLHVDLKDQNFGCNKITPNPASPICYSRLECQSQILCWVFNRRKLENSWILRSVKHPSLMTRVLKP